MKEQLRKIYPELNDEELEEAEWNIRGYARTLAEMYLRMRREKAIKRLKDETIASKKES